MKVHFSVFHLYPYCHSEYFHIDFYGLTHSGLELLYWPFDSHGARVQSMATFVTVMVWLIKKSRLETDKKTLTMALSL